MPTFMQFTGAQVPTLDEAGNGPVAMFAYGTATDDQHVLFATSVSDRDTKYSNVRTGTLVSCAALGIIWQKTTSPPTTAAWRTIVEFGKPNIQRGIVTMPAVSANAGVAVSVSFPVPFLAPPILVVSADSNGYGVASSSPPSTTGFIAKYYNPTATVPTNPRVHWTAIEASA